MEKTILVVFSGDRDAINNYDLKRYAFNTDAEVEVGDKLKSDAYGDCMIIDKVLSKKFEYFNKGTGELTDELNSSNSFKIKKLKVIDVNDENITVARKVID